MKYLAVVFFIISFLPLLKAQESEIAEPFRYVAHRGASYLAPENTLASIELAWEPGADAAECDLMLTADQQLSGSQISFIAFDFETIRQIKALYPGRPG